MIEKGSEFTEYRELERPDYDHPRVEDFIVVPFVAFGIYICKRTIYAFTIGFFTRKLSKKYSGQILEDKIKKCCKGIFKFFFFGSNFIFGWRFVLPNTSFMAPIMLGNGNGQLVMSDYPFMEMTPYIKEYYIIELAYFVEDLFSHLLTTPTNDYFEMILHHLVAFMLIYIAYVYGVWTYGILVLMQMDLADAWVGLIRAVMDFTHDVI